MKKSALIYVTGHTGMVGSAIVRRLLASGYRNLLLKTHGELDLTNQQAALDFLKAKKPEYVFLCAARVGGIHANSVFPAEFIYQNAIIAINIIDAARVSKVKKLLYLGCSCIYPKHAPNPIREETLLTGSIEPTNEPYAVAKILGVKLCQAYTRQYGNDFIVAIPSNVYGVGERHFDSSGHVIPGLIRNFDIAKKERSPTVIVWGSGKPKRDFLYVDDLAEAGIFLMERYSGSEVINVGTGLGVSIARLARIVKKAVGFSGKIVYDIRKPDGMPARVIDTRKIKALGWEPKTKLEDGLRWTYQWYKGRFRG